MAEVSGAEAVCGAACHHGKGPRGVGGDPLTRRIGPTYGEDDRNCGRFKGLRSEHLRLLTA